MKNDKEGKRMPLWLIYTLDLLLGVAMLLTFCYFHHVRTLWGLGTATEGIETIETDAPSATAKRPSQTECLTHEWTLKEVVPPTCTEQGYTVYVCTVCGSEKNDDRTDATGHTKGGPTGVTAATETENGYTGDIYCTVCGTLLEKGREIPATEHENAELVNVRAATCTETGYSGDWYCPDCGKIVAAGAETPVLEHEYEVSGTVEATCQSEGCTLYTCKNCGATYRSDYTSLADHKCGTDGKCIWCGIGMLDTSGDFGASFPQMFIQTSEKVSLSDESEIIAYCKANGIELEDREDTEYIALYRSHDIFLIVTETNTQMYYAGTGKSYQEQYFIYDIYVRNLSNLCTSYNVSEREAMSDLIAEVEKTRGDVVAAVNGDYMGNTNFCRVCVRNGIVYRYTDDVSADVGVLYYDGTLKTYSRSEFSWEEVEAGKPYQVWSFGPALVDENGDPVTEYNSTLDSQIINNRHPRTAIGYYEPGHYTFVVVDGRSDDSEGVRLVQLAQLMADLGCTAAYNLDGGDSSQAWVGDTVIREKQAAESDQRALWDIVCICENSNGG